MHNKSISLSVRLAIITTSGWWLLPSHLFSISHPTLLLLPSSVQLFLSLYWERIEYSASGNRYAKREEEKEAERYYQNSSILTIVLYLAASQS